MSMNDFGIAMPIDNLGVIEVSNPFTKTITDTGIFLKKDMDLSAETGQLERLEQDIKFGLVAIVGPDVKSLKPGYGIYFKRHSVQPIPFKDGLLMINERSILAIVPADGDELLQLVKDFEDQESEYAKLAEQKRQQENFANSLGVSTKIIV